MKVKDLIEKLSKLDPDMQVVNDVETVGLFNAADIAVFNAYDNGGEYAPDDDGDVTVVGII